jgi:hypothetical protein
MGIETGPKDQSTVVAGELPLDLGTPASIADHVEHTDGDPSTNGREEHQPLGEN